jgi:hypothetical protein
VEDEAVAGTKRSALAVEQPHVRADRRPGVGRLAGSGNAFEFFFALKLPPSYTNVVLKCPFKASALFCFLYLWSGPCPIANNLAVILTSVH